MEDNFPSRRTDRHVSVMCSEQLVRVVVQVPVQLGQQTTPDLHWPQIPGNVLEVAAISNACSVCMYELRPHALLDDL
ncbi:hypothetical protein RRG08_010305 [Elysia crispata]|uniref:Uncharacterized protein n=1 Tax=Elysia crispata TaxID=231223 RepID=A0AAE1D8V1_9GAST|nr:hypothetical protein RRG08_010305 [Elysia crispata]